MCDCGDSEAWNPKGNCSEHTGFITEDKLLPPTIKLALTKVVKQTIFFIFQLVEIKPKKALRSRAKLLLIEVLEILSELCALYPTITPVISNIFISDLNYSTKAKIKMYHDAAVLDGISRQLREAKEVNTTGLQLIFRYHQKFSDDIKDSLGSVLKKFVIGLFVDYEFKKTFAVHFINYFNFLYDILMAKPGSNPSSSHFTGIAIQFLTSEELALFALENSNVSYFLDSITGILKRLVSEKTGEINTTEIFVQYSLIQPLQYCLMKKKGIQFFFSNVELVQKFFKIFKIFQQHKIFIDSDTQGKNLTTIDKIASNQTDICESLLSNYIQIMSIIITLEEAEKKTIVVNCLTTLANEISSIEGKNHKEKKDVRSHIFLLERTFTMTVVTYCYFKATPQGKVLTTDFQVDKYLELMEQIFPDKTSREGFWKLMTCNITQLTAFMREISRGFWVGYIKVEQVQLDLPEDQKLLLHQQLFLHRHRLLAALQP